MIMGVLHMSDNANSQLSLLHNIANIPSFEVIADHSHDQIDMCTNVNGQKQCDHKMQKT